MLKPTLANVFLALAVICHAASTADADVVDSTRFKIDGAVIVWSADTGTGLPIVADFIIDTGSGTTAVTSGDIDLIAVETGTIVTGTLDPTSGLMAPNQGVPMTVDNAMVMGSFSTDSNGDGVMDAADSFSAFSLSETTRATTQTMEVNSSFYVASSVPFSIDGVATPVGATTPTQMSEMRFFIDPVMLSGDDGFAFGGAAQYPHSGGGLAGRQNDNSRFSDMQSPVNIFTGNQRTAANRGTLVEQSVRFNLRYRYSSGDFDLSDGVFEAAAEFAYTVFIP